MDHGFCMLSELAAQDCSQLRVSRALLLRVTGVLVWKEEDGRLHLLIYGTLQDPISLLHAIAKPLS